MGISKDHPAVKTAYKFLKVAPRLWETGISAGMLWNGDGGIINDSSSGYICHAFFNRGYEDVEVAFSTLTARYRNASYEKEYQIFMEYLAKENPVGRQFIINNDDLSSIFEGGIIINAREAGYNRTLWLGKAFRWCNEEPYRVHNWFRLIEKGVHPLVAMIAASFLREDGNLQAGRTFTHAQVFANPESIEALAEALSVTSFKPMRNYREKVVEREDTSTVFWKRTVVLTGRPENKEGIIKDCIGSQKTERIPDGWGGYIERKINASDKWDNLASHLKDLTTKALALKKTDKEEKNG